MAENQPNTNKDSYWKGLYTGIGLTALTLQLLFGPFTADPNPDTSDRQDQSTPADSVPNTCPKQPVEHPAENDLAPIEYAVDTEQLSFYTDLLNRAQSFDEASGLLSQVFNRWDYNVHIAEVPTLSSQDFATRGSDVEHTPELITQQLVNVSAIHILESLSHVPVALLEITSGTDLYLTIGITNESGGYGGLYSKDEDGNPFMIVGIGQADPSGEIFEHELAHNLFFRLCGDNIGYNDTELASFNPPGWFYTRSNVTHDYWYGITASRYGATSTPEDTADAFPQLLVLPLGRTCLRDEVTEPYFSPICNKWNLLIQRVAVESPETAAYLARS